jgi:cbb3-type cytochrome oxidase maturation protein
LSILLWLIPAALFLGLLGLGAFLWALRSGQFDDLDGAAHRILFEDEDEAPPPPPPPSPPEDPNKR